MKFKGVNWLLFTLIFLKAYVFRCPGIFEIAKWEEPHYNRIIIVQTNKEVVRYEGFELRVLSGRGAAGQIRD